MAKCQVIPAVWNMKEPLPGSCLHACMPTDGRCKSVINGRHWIGSAVFSLIKFWELHTEQHYLENIFFLNSVIQEYIKLFCGRIYFSKQALKLKLRLENLISLFFFRSLGMAMKKKCVRTSYRPWLLASTSWQNKIVYNWNLMPEFSCNCTNLNKKKKCFTLMWSRSYNLKH